MQKVLEEAGGWRVRHWSATKTKSLECVEARAELDRSAAAAIRRWEGYAETPVHSLASVASAVGVAEVWAKDESGRFGTGSFKPLGSALVVEELAAKHGADITVSAASDGNHGLGLAWGARRAGCRAVVYLGAAVSATMSAKIEAFGATVVRVDGGYEASIEACRRDADERGWYVVQDVAREGYVDIPRRIHSGYSVVATEIIEAGLEPTHVLLNSGVGGFAAGVFACLSRHARPRFATVEPTEADCLLRRANGDGPTTKGPTVQVGLDCHDPCPLAWRALEGLVDDFLAVPDEAVAPVVRFLAADYDLHVGESAVAGLAALVAAAKNPDLKAALELDRESRVLVVLCEAPPDLDAHHALLLLDREEEEGR
ncbi:hypothetical protein CTAYLR_008745 [Chrysophaeum taylorii]|uniref:Tryptophan synthase beta chain-like PALP domain-containing protein n=1 Tax=Chrysophaeum taylorii TaxID=2483200 RepID=A0AAD7XQ81_9STRA|nr:hypothetical protein CTAYLR_008745 [Chrysophaeum taylorii]